MSMALRSLTDEYLDSQKRTGCMTGIFQLFDWYHKGVSGRRISDQCHRSTLQHKPCHSQSTDGRLEEEFIVAHQRQPADMNSYRDASDRQRFSTESSRASFSSSRSSSFSSVDYYRGIQPDHANNDRITFSGAAFENSHRILSPRLARQSADFRDVVIDSMLREARGSSMKTSSNEEIMNGGLKRRDTLKDLKLFKTVDGARTKGAQHVCDNLKEFVDVSSKLQGAEWAYNKRKEQQRMSDYGYRSKDASRPSYDEMETSRLSFDSREALSASKLKDLPRLSLDGRGCLMHRVDCNSSSNFQSFTSLKKSYSTREKGQCVLEVSMPQQRRSPSVIAKLMGLTALPDSSAQDTPNDRSFFRTRNGQDGSDALDTGNPILKSEPPCLEKEPASPRWITSEMKPISSSRIPVEQAPWKHQEKGATLVRHSSRRIRSPMRQSNPIPSVYSEIEKRFKDMEFNQSAKDLRALKQILESIHAKGLLEEEKKGQASKLTNSGKQECTLIKAKPKKASMNQQKAPGEHFNAVVPKCDISFRPSDTQSQIVTVKSICRSPRSQTSKNMYNDRVVGSTEKCKSTQPSSRPQLQLKDNSANSPRKLGSTSPRLRLKKLESEKQNQSPSHSSDASKNRVQTPKHQTESSSPGRRVLPRLTSKQKNGNRVSEILLEIRKLRSRTNEAPLPADRNACFDSKRDKEVTRTMRSNKVHGSDSLSRKASKEVILASNKASNHISFPVKHEETAPEHTSPVSVLNMSPYLDDSSTEEKQIATPPEDLAEGYGTCKSNMSGELVISSENEKKLLSINSLIQKLKQLKSTHDESMTDYIALLCDTTNPGHRYISEILLASGLLLQEFDSDAKPVQLLSSGFLINPEVFNVLEQTKSSAKTSVNDDADESKSCRKLIFDTVNELLTKKLASNGNLTDYTFKHRHPLAKKTVGTQNLIKELCAGMEQLHPKKKKNQENNMEREDECDAVKDVLREDVMSSDKWNVLEGGLSDVVLDIERSLFKKLVNEIVISDYRLLRPMSGNRHNRFIK